MSSTKKKSTLRNRTNTEKRIISLNQENKKLSAKKITVNINLLKSKSEIKKKELEDNKNDITNQIEKNNTEINKLHTDLKNINNYRNGLRNAVLPTIQENLTLKEKGKGKEMYNDDEFRKDLTKHRKTTRKFVEKQAVNAAGGKKARKSKKNYWFF